MEHDIPFGNSNRENGTTFLDFPLFLGIFQWNEPTKRVPFTGEPEIPEILTKWKAPLVSRTKFILREELLSLNFVSRSHNRKGPQEHDTFAYSRTMMETMGNFSLKRTATR